MGWINFICMDACKKTFRYLIILFASALLINCSDNYKKNAQVFTGADLLVSENLELIKNKNLGIITNHTGILKSSVHLVDTLLKIDEINIIALFGPEHGIRGNSPDGLSIEDDIDKKSMIPIFSLYGKTRKPTAEMLSEIELLIFDIQDIGSRFYTFISTMYYSIQSAAENNIPIIILDRPNPINGNISDGPILLKDYLSFVGIAEIPIRHGMTIAELAYFFNQKNILGLENIAELKIIKMKNWDRDYFFDQCNLPWSPPSPNMTTLETALVYPGLCLIEGTNISEGRGTDKPFLQFGSPFINSEHVIEDVTKLGISGCNLSVTKFTPKSIPNKSINPKYLEEECNGISIIVKDYNLFNPIEFSVKLIYVFNKLYPEKFTFNEKWIDKLWGSNNFRIGIESGSTPNNIISEYKTSLKKFNETRAKFLIY